MMYQNTILLAIQNLEKNLLKYFFLFLTFYCLSGYAKTLEPSTNGIGFCDGINNTALVTITTRAYLPPSISLENKSVVNDENGDGLAQVGETITYFFTVINTGDQPLTNVDIESELLGGFVCTIPALAIGDRNMSCSASYSITQIDIDNGTVINIATATGQDTNGDDVTDETSDDPDDPTNTDNNADGEPDDPTIDPLLIAPSLELEVAAVFNDENGDEIAQPAETISYSYTITNIGNVTLTDVEIEDSIVSCAITTLAPGETNSSCSSSYAITPLEITNGSVSYVARVNGVNPNGILITDISDDPNDPTNANINGNPNDPTIIILPEILFEIFNTISPDDGDNLNEFFLLSGIEHFPNNNVKIFNRWGVLVFETDGYGGSTGKENIFRGYSNGQGTITKDRLFPVGTYYYIIIREDPTTGESLTNKGFLYIN